MGNVITTLGRAITLVQHAQELMFRQEEQTPDIVEAIDHLDSLLNILHGLREEEREIARFESGFRDTGLEEVDGIDAEEEAERLEEFQEERERTLAEYEIHRQFGPEF